MKIKNLHIKNLHVTANKKPTGLTNADPGTSAWQIKQDYPASSDGLYWIQNANINSGEPVQIYADMTTLGGGWTLVLQNNNAGPWNFDNCSLYNQTSPPSTLTNGGTYDAANDYSIIGWSDYIKRAPSGFDYMIDAFARGRNGGAWTANGTYSFLDQADGSTFFGSDTVNGSDGFHQNITELTKFPIGAGNPGDTSYWNYADNGLEHRMPWYANRLDAPGYPFVGGAIFTTSHDDNGSWWGTLMTLGQQNWNPAPYQDDTGYGDPNVIWLWVR